MVQTSPSPYRAAQCLVETPLENQQLILPEDPCLSMALTRVNPWVYSHRGKRWPRKTVSFYLFSSGKQTWSVTSFSPSPLLVLHLTNIYRIFASGIGNMEIKESRQCSLVLWDLGSNGSAQGCLWWPHLPAYTLPLVCLQLHHHHLSYQAGLSYLDCSSATGCFTSMTSMLCWLTWHTESAVWRRMARLPIR